MNDDIQIKLSAATIKLIGKLWDTFDKNLSGFLGPFHTVMAAKAKRKCDLIEAQTKKDIEAIESGKASVNLKGEIIPAKQKSLPQGNDNILGFQQAGDDADIFVPTPQNYINKIFIDERTKMSNLASTLRKSIEYIETTENEAMSDQEVDKDWFTSWRQKAENISNHEVQSLWALILAEEVKFPGSFSIRSLEILKNFTKAEAEIVNRFSKLVINNAVYHDRPDKVNAFSISKLDILQVQSIGLLFGVADFFAENFKPQTVENLMSNQRDNNRKIGFEKYRTALYPSVKIRDLKNRNFFIFDALNPISKILIYVDEVYNDMILTNMPLTKEGIEIFHLSEQTSELEYIYSFCEFFSAMDGFEAFIISKKKIKGLDWKPYNKGTFIAEITHKIMKRK